MKQIALIITILFIISCGDNATDDNNTPVTDSARRHADSTDSVKRLQEEEEVSEELIHGAFDALNR